MADTDCGPLCNFNIAFVRCNLFISHLSTSSTHLLLLLLRVVTNTLPLLTGTIYRMTLETVALLAF